MFSHEMWRTRAPARLTPQVRSSRQGTFIHQDRRLLVWRLSQHGTAEKAWRYAPYVPDGRDGRFTQRVTISRTRSPSSSPSACRTAFLTGRNQPPVSLSGKTELGQ